MPKETIYIAPGHSQCRVYALPYQMRPGQSPDHIDCRYRNAWKEIGLLNFELRLVCIDPGYADLSEDITGQMGGTYFEVERPASAFNSKPAESAKAF